MIPILEAEIDYVMAMMEPQNRQPGIVMWWALNRLACEAAWPDDGEWFPATHSQINRYTKFSRTRHTIPKFLAIFERAGILEIKRGDESRANRYRIIGIPNSTPNGGIPRVDSKKATVRTARKSPMLTFNPLLGIYEN